MLEKIIVKLHSKIADRFDQFYPLVELIEVSEDKVLPKQYVSDGQYKAINFDNFAGVGYFRIKEPVTIEESESPTPKPVHDFKYSLRLVGCIKKSVIGRDDPYSCDTLCLTLTKDLEAANRFIMQEVSARRGSVEVTSYQTVASEVVKEEFSGVENFKSVPFDYCLVSLDITVTINTTKECINNNCQSYCNEL